MTKEQIREYLGIALDMEKNVYVQETLIKELENKIEKLAIPANISVPYDESIIYDIEEPKKTGWRKLLVWFIVCLVAIMSFIGNAVQSGHGGTIGVAILFSFGIGFIAFILFIFMLNSRIDEKKNIKAYEDTRQKFAKEKQDYAIKMVKYNQDVQADNMRVEKEQKEREVLLQTVEYVENNLKNAKQTLNMVYYRGILFNKYWSLPMVATLYEYFLSGRCDSLEGANGGYNLLEMEIRMDRIIVQLDKVIAKLGSIQANQWSLYAAIQDGNRQIQTLTESVNRVAGNISALDSNISNLGRSISNGIDRQNSRLSAIQKSSELTAYYAERNQKELEYMNRMDYLCGRNSDTFFNVPPSSSIYDI